ncbi:hypothetical protein [Fodinibius sp. Rm-B-1B1-1]|uniref:hypothetical protein n=1 Tax=Fodinibius alkaliphilus TaxID=3140241 RepID=UPI00315AB3BD
MNFWNNLFKTDKKPTKGEALFFKIFELFVIVFVLKYAWQWGPYIQQIGEVVLPLGIAQYVDVSFMFEHNISLVNAALISVFAILGFVRIFPKYSYLIALAFFHLHYVSRFSLGEISHGSNFIGMSLFALGLGLFFFGNNPVQYRRFTMGFIFFFFGLGYTSAAISKLIGTGLTWPSGKHLWLWIAERSVDVASAKGQFIPNIVQEWVLDYRFLGTLSLVFGLLAEFFGFLLWFDKTRPYIATALIMMHFGVYLTMSIMFDVYIYELLIIGYPWAKLIDRYLNFESNPLLRKTYQWSIRIS